MELALFLPIDSPRSPSNDLKIYYSLPPSGNLWDVDDYIIGKAHYRLKFLKDIVSYRPDIIQTIDTYPWLIDGGVASLVCNSPFFRWCTWYLCHNTYISHLNKAHHDRLSQLS